SGHTEAGRPYLVMEWVEGRPIDRYCAEEGLDLRQTLSLFRTLSRAVEHAHRNLVVHRDLKPANILITPDGEPKLLDFGISKLLDADSKVPFTVTRHGWQVMTPQYASPEQIRGLPATTSCDVYGLGVVLFQLLTGVRPFDGGGESLLERICDEEPTRPSRLGTAAELGGHERRHLRGDLDTIVLKALAKDPKHRYRSVAELDADLGRYLAELPIEARPPSAAYRFSKLVRRRRGWVAVAAMLLVLLVGVTIERERQRRATERERDKAVAIQAFLMDVFAKADPGKGHDGRLEVRDLLHQGVAQIDALADQPTVQGDVSSVLGQIYRNLGFLDEGEALLRRALDLHIEHRGVDSTETCITRNQLGLLLDARGAFDEAARQFEAALDTTRRVRPDDQEAMAEVINNLALVRLGQGRVAEATELARENLDLRRQFYGERHVETALGYNNLGWVLVQTPEPPLDEAVDILTRGLDLRLELQGESHPDVANAYNNLAAAVLYQGDLDRAQRLFRSALDIWQHFLGDHHKDVMVGEINLLAVRLRKGDGESMRPDVEALRARIVEHLGVGHPYDVEMQRMLAELDRVASGSPVSAPALAPTAEAEDVAR
ncbi:MAG: serine/threonine-protein kinase, partial [Acidobacteriota bacterium]